MIGVPRISVGQKYDSASGESVSGQDVMHDSIVTVGVDTYDIGMSECPFKTYIGYAFRRSGYS